ncbi:MAG: TetR/AcrR family transcriptional regulator [Oscillospiraceae bacterium]
MANYTEKAIFRAFEELLEEKPFDKITVSAIVSKSEVSANTFYYHFQDIYDLLDKWLDRKKNQSFAMTQLTGSWTDRLKVLLHAMQECLCLVKKQNQNTSIDSSLPLFRSLKELAKICYNFQNSRTFDVAKPLYIMKGGLERYGFGRTI